MALVILAGKVGATTQLTRRTACVGKKRGVLPGFGVAVAIAHVCVSFFFPKRSSSLMLVFFAVGAVRPLFSWIYTKDLYEVFGSRR